MAGKEKKMAAIGSYGCAGSGGGSSSSQSVSQSLSDVSSAAAAAAADNAHSRGHIQEQSEGERAGRLSTCLDN